MNNFGKKDNTGLAVNIENLSVHYDETPALESVSLKVMNGEYLGIIGPNGGGKTTLLKSILGLVSPSSGSIKIYCEKQKNSGCIGYVPQTAGIDKSFPIDVRGVVLAARLGGRIKLFHKYKKIDIETADEFLESVGIYNLRKRQISALSGGEFQKMLIARALVINPGILLLDEPTASVDAASRDQIYSLLNDLNKKMTIILVTHDLLAVSSHVKTLACLNGRLVYHGSAELTEEIAETLYGCPIDLIAHGVPHRVLKEHKREE